MAASSPGATLAAEGDATELVPGVPTVLVAALSVSVILKIRLQKILSLSCRLNRGSLSLLIPVKVRCSSILIICLGCLNQNRILYFRGASRLRVHRFLTTKSGLIMLPISSIPTARAYPPIRRCMLNAGRFNLCQTKTKRAVISVGEFNWPMVLHR